MMTCKVQAYCILQSKWALHPSTPQISELRILAERIGMRRHLRMVCNFCYMRVACIYYVFCHVLEVRAWLMGYCNVQLWTWSGMGQWQPT